MSKSISLIVEPDFCDIRIDKYIAAINPQFSRTYIQKLIKEEAVHVNDQTVKASYEVSIGDEINFIIPDSIVPDIEPENIPIDVVYEDNDIIVVYKPKGMVVHPACGNYSGTLVNALMYRFKDSLSGINGVLRPGIVHRIDKDTTGILLVCKNDNAHRIIAERLKEHSIVRRYYAICCGELQEEELTIDAPIGRNATDRKKMGIDRKNGKNAVTHVKVLEHLKGYTFIECRLETGRTHQIRVHMSSIGHPLLGDETYGGLRKGFDTNGQCLHAGILGLELLETKEYREFSYPLPDYFTKILDELRSR